MYKACDRGLTGRFFHGEAQQLVNFSSYSQHSESETIVIGFGISQTRIKEDFCKYFRLAKLI